MAAAALTAADLQQRLSAEFPETFNPTSGLSVVEVRHGFARMRLGFQQSTLRPGGTISGPTIMMLADVTMYVAVLAAIGWPGAA